MTLRTKFALWALVLVELALASCLLVALLLERRHLEAQQRHSLTLGLKRFVSVCRDSILERNDLPLLNYIKTMSASPEIRYMVLTDVQNKVRIHSALLSGDSSRLGQAWEIPEDSSEMGLRVRARLDQGIAIEDWSIAVFVEKRWTGNAHLGYDQAALAAALDKSLRESALRLLMAGALLSIGGLAGAWTLAWHINRPISDLGLATRALGEGNLDYRIEPSTRDELGELAGSFNVMAQRMTRLQELREQTMSSVTHDLQAPLSAILNYTHLLRASAAPRLQKEDSEALDAIASSVKRLSLMTQDILDLSRLKAGKLVLHKIPTDLSEIVAEAARVMASTAMELGVEVKIEIPPSLPLIAVDSALIVRVLVNLVANSLRFTPKYGTVGFAASLKDGDVEVSVADTGLGIASEHIPRLFTRFSQVPESMGVLRKGVGTGLGFSICSEIVAAHGGRIWAESKLGAGTTIFFTLPRG